MVIAPARTGRDNNSKMAVIRTDQGNMGTRSNKVPKTRRFIIVLIKFTAPNKEEAPAICKEKIARSTATPE